MSRENVTGLLRLLQDFFQIKMENIYLFKIIMIKKHGNVFKTWLCPNFLLLPKKSELPKIWEGCSPPFEFWVLRFRDLGVFFFDLGCFVFEFWVLRFRGLGASYFGLRFRVLRFRNYPIKYSNYSCLPFEMQLLKAVL